MQDASSSKCLEFQKDAATFRTHCDSFLHLGERTEGKQMANNLGVSSTFGGAEGAPTSYPQFSLERAEVVR